MQSTYYNLQRQLINWTIANSGAEHRDYLGMSAIGGCSRQLYTQMVRGRQWSSRDHHYCYLGYLFERDVLARLAAIDPEALGPSQDLSDFGGRFQGHTDGSWNGALLEIKSTTHEKLPRSGQIPRRHHWQVQCYMHYSGHRKAQIIYVARDTGHLKVIEIPRSERTGELARLKAISILEAVDAGQPPECECGRCNV